MWRVVIHDTAMILLLIGAGIIVTAALAVALAGIAGGIITFLG